MQINSTKSEIGIVRKHYIDLINKFIKEKLDVTQWKNTQPVITWFKNIKSKSSSSFTKIDIVDFYPLHIKGPFIKSNRFCKINYTYSRQVH